MSTWNQVQQRLVELSERVHYHGIRHAGLCGAIYEDVLIGELQKAIPQLRFGRGIIKFAPTTDFGKALLPQQLSGQVDVIVFRGDPQFEVQNAVAVHIEQVAAVIEVKKWQNLSDTPARKNDIVKWKDLLLKHSGRPIPVFLVTYRFEDRGKPANWMEFQAGIPSDHVYAFYGGLTRKRSISLYPWEEDKWATFNGHTYAGQLGRLVRDLDALVTGR